MLIRPYLMPIPPQPPTRPDPPGTPPEPIDPPLHDPVHDPPPMRDPDNVKRPVARRIQPQHALCLQSSAQGMRLLRSRMPRPITHLLCDLITYQFDRP